MKLTDFDYHLPPERIAQQPARKRDHSRLLVLSRTDGRCDHHRFYELPDFLSASDVMVVNNTRVVPARLVGRKETGGRAEILILNFRGEGQPADDGRCYDCLVKAAKRPRPGTRLFFDGGLKGCITATRDQTHTIEFNCQGSLAAYLQQYGHVPLPPYIRRSDSPPPVDDDSAYQTVYARHAGAVAAPTAGFHFRPETLTEIRKKGVEIVEITLHIGYGTFSPVRTADIRRHQMHAEWYAIPAQTAAAVNRAREQKRRILAVGTTCVRSLEFSARRDGRVHAGSGMCDLFIYPGFTFRIVDAMVTNFHLPRSTLLMLVSAFAGRENIQQAYRSAVDLGYRFYSYGDAMLIR